MVSVRWTGAAGLEFSHAGKVYLMDPYVSRSGKIAIFLGRLHPRQDAIDRFLDDLPGGLQAIMLGHTHFDHALDIPAIAARRPVPLIGSASLAALLEACGMPGRVTVCRGGERVALPGGATVTMIPALHGRVFFGRIPYPGEITPDVRPPLKAADYRLGQVFSMRLELGGTVFLHIGSANLIDAALEGQRCDVLFLCLSGWKKIPDYHHRILSRTQPQVVIPFHFDDFSVPLRWDGSAPDLPLLDKEGFQRQIARCAPQARVIWPAVNQPMDF